MPDIGTAYNVIDPDGFPTVLTCTERQLNEVWIPKGFKLAEEASSVSDEPKTKATAQKVD